MLASRQTRIFAHYHYDSYGNYSRSGSTDLDLAENNPIRYRSYYFDEDTGLYYLNARYYNPLWRRFISPDDTAYLDPDTPNGLNLYAYCGNDPVNYADPSGNFAISLSFLAVSALIGTVVGAGVSGALAYSQGERGWDLVWDIVGGAITGAASGIATALGGAAGLGAVAGSAMIGTNISFGAAVGISIASMAFANATKYSLKCASNNNEWNLGGYILSGAEGVLQGIATFGISYLGGKSGAFNKLANFSTEDVFFTQYGGVNSMRAFMWGAKSLMGETVSRAFFISGTSAFTRFIIDSIIPNLY